MLKVLFCTFSHWFVKRLRGVIVSKFTLKIIPAYAELSAQTHVDETILTGCRATAFLSCCTAINQRVIFCRGDGTRLFFFLLLEDLSAFVGKLLTYSGVLQEHFMLTFLDTLVASCCEGFLSRDNTIHYLQI